MMCESKSEELNQFSCSAKKYSNPKPDLSCKSVCDFANGVFGLVSNNKSKIISKGYLLTNCSALGRKIATSNLFLKFTSSL